MTSRKGGAMCAVALSIVLTCSFASAQSTENATAEALFEQGRELLRKGKASEACPKLAESLRLDPATGTMLAVAMCHEADGKLASAWAEFIEVQQRSRAEGRADRQQIASTHAGALVPRLSTLAINVPNDVASVPGLEIRRDGTILGPGAWNTPTPIDGGEHVVDVTAPGKKPARFTATVSPEGQAAIVTLAALEAVPLPVTEAPRTASPPADATPPRRSQTLPWSLMGIGAAVAIGGGVFAAVEAGKANSAADARNRADYDSAKSAATIGDVVAGIGLAGAAVGAVMLLTMPSQPEHVSTSNWQPKPWAFRSGGGAAVECFW